MTDNKRDNLSTIIDDFVYDLPVPEFSCMSGPLSGWDSLRSTLSSDYRLVDLILNSIKAKPLVWKHSTSKVHEGCVEYAETPFGTYFINYDNDDFTGMYCDFFYLGNCTWFGTGGANSQEITSHVHEDEPYTKTKAAAEAHHQETFKGNLVIGEH